MTSTDLIKLALSFVVGGAWVTGATVVAERYGSRAGGWLAGLPSTSLIAFLFIGWTGGPAVVHAVTTAFPVTFAVNAVLLCCYVLLAPRALWLGLGVGLTAWTALQVLVVFHPPAGYGLALALWAGVMGVAYAVLRASLGPWSIQRVRIAYTPGQILGRALMSGTIIAAAVLLSRIGGPVFGSVFSAFPAVYLSTLLIAGRSGGVAFARTLVPALLLSGMVNCIAFATVFRYTVAATSVAAATVIGYLGSMVTAWGTLWFLRATSAPDRGEPAPGRPVSRSTRWRGQPDPAREVDR